MQHRSFATRLDIDWKRSLDSVDLVILMNVMSLKIGILGFFKLVVTRF